MVHALHEKYTGIPCVSEHDPHKLSRKMRKRGPLVTAVGLGARKSTAVISVSMHMLASYAIQ